jgi:acetyl esterase/lipase
MLALLLAAALSAHADGAVHAEVAYGKDPKQRFDVYRPAAASTALRPVVVFFHGGVWQFGDRSDVANVGAAAVDAGFIGVVASYRLAPTHRWPAQRDDAVAVLAHVAQHARSFGGDPTQIVLVGHSAGGQLAGVLLYDKDVVRAAGVDPSVVKGVVFVSGVFDVQAPLDEGQGDGGFARFVAPVFGRDKATLRAASPLWIAGPTQTPLLLITGSDDYGAMREQSFAMARRLAFFTADKRAPAVVDVDGRDHFGLISGLTAQDAVGARVFAFARAHTVR